MTLKEEIELRIGLMQERIGRLQAEFMIAQNLMTTLQRQLKEIEEKKIEESKIEHGKPTN